MCSSASLIVSWSSRGIRARFERFCNINLNNCNVCAVFVAWGNSCDLCTYENTMHMVMQRPSLQKKREELCQELRRNVPSGIGVTKLDRPDIVHTSILRANPLNKDSEVVHDFCRISGNHVYAMYAFIICLLLIHCCDWSDHGHMTTLQN